MHDRMMAIGAALVVAGACVFGALACSDDSGGSPGSSCGEACKHLEQCGVARIKINAVKSYAYDPGCNQVCDPITECVSKCVKAASCGELQTVQLNGTLHSCMIGCNGWFAVGDGGP